jgi:thiol-disulfide isomerase/thioredoxin
MYWTVTAGRKTPSNCETLIRTVSNISPKRLPMATMKECPVCGIRVKLENMETHLKKVHPRARIDAVLTEDDKTDIKIAKKKVMKTAKPFEDRERRRWTIAGILIAVVVASLFILFAVLSPQTSGHIMKGRDVPLFTYGDVDGNAYTLNEYIGDAPILIEFFYTECGYCIQMAPNMVELYAFYGYGADVEFVSISADDRDLLQDVRNFRDQHGSTWTYIKAPTSLGSTYKVTGTPTFFLVDKSGVIKEVEVGLRSVQDMKDLIKDYL